MDSRTRIRVNAPYEAELENRCHATRAPKTAAVTPPSSRRRAVASRLRSPASPTPWTRAGGRRSRCEPDVPAPRSSTEGQSLIGTTTELDHLGQLRLGQRVRGDPRRSGQSGGGSGQGQPRGTGEARERSEAQ